MFCPAIPSTISATTLHTVALNHHRQLMGLLMGA
jgi:hypothetical protein